MKKALIWGVTGQDGAYLTELLLNKGYKVVGVARRTSQPSDRHIGTFLLDENFKLVHGDITDAGSVNRIVRENAPWAEIEGMANLESPYEIYNLAAQSHVKLSFDEPNHTTDVTYKGCLNILETIRSSPVLKSFSRFYQASSSEMFGSAYSCQVNTKHGPRIVHYNGNGWMPTGEPGSWHQNEYTPFLPNSPYAIAKLAAHNAVRMYRDAYKIHASSGILFNHESEKRGDLFVTQKIAKWAAQCYHLRYTVLSFVPMNLPELHLGNMDASRDWGYAGDYVEAMWLMLQQDKPDDYVVATGETHTVKEFVQEALNVIGVPYDAVTIKTDNDLLRPSEVPYLRGDASKAEKILGWKPKTTFKQLVEKMVRNQIDLLDR